MKGKSLLSFIFVLLFVWRGNAAPTLQRYNLVNAVPYAPCSWQQNFILNDPNNDITNVAINAGPGSISPDPITKIYTVLYSNVASGATTTMVSVTYGIVSVLTTTFYLPLFFCENPPAVLTSTVVAFTQPFTNMDKWVLQFELDQRINFIASANCRPSDISLFCTFLYDLERQVFNVLITPNMNTMVDTSLLHNVTLNVNFNANVNPTAIQLQLPPFYRVGSHINQIQETSPSVYYPLNASTPIVVPKNKIFPFTAFMYTNSTGSSPPIVTYNLSLKSRPRKLQYNGGDGSRGTIVWGIGPTQNVIDQSTKSYQIFSMNEQGYKLLARQAYNITLEPIGAPPGYQLSRLNNGSFIYYNQKLNISSFGELSWQINSYKFKIPYPFGLTRKANMTTFTHSLMMYPGPFIPALNISILFDTYFIPSQGIVMEPSQDTIPPAVASINFKPASFNSFFVSMVITDNLSGVQLIIINDNELFSANQYRVSGNRLSGTYVFEYKNGDVNGFKKISSISVYDSANNVNQVDLNDFDGYLAVAPQQTCNGYCSLKLNNISSIEFYPNDLDTRDGPASTSLLFTLNAPFDTTMKPIINVYRDLDFGFAGPRNYIEVEGYYDPYIGKFRADFSVPQKSFEGTVYYEINDQVNSIGLESLFGDISQLRVYSSGSSDCMPPIVTDITPSSTDIVLYRDETVLTFTISISDTVNGFSNGEVSFVSSAHPVPYRYTFTVADRVSGTPTQSSYQFKLTLTQGCIPHNITLQSIKLVDAGGWTSQYPIPDDIIDGKGKQNTYIDPLYKVRYTSMPVVKVSSATPPTDFNTPTIYGLDITPFTAIDVTSRNRILTVYARAQDDSNTLLSGPYLPKLYLMDSFGGSLSLEPVSVSIQLNPVIYFYNYNTTLPYGFGGDQGILVSLYGLTDPTLNIGSASSYELISYSIPCKIDTLMTHSAVIIESASRLFKFGGQLTISGRRFTSDLIGFIDQRGSGFGNVTTVVVNQIQIILTIPPVNVLSFDIKLIGNGNITSNIFTVYPMDYIPLREITDSCGSPVCSGHGTCLSGVCLCSRGWSGNLCADIVIDTNPPILDNNTASVNVSGSGSLDLFGSIKIHSVREISGLDGSVVQKFEFGNWTLRNQSTDGSFNFIYSTILPNTSTQLNVTIQFFENQTSIVFAGEQLQMAPSTTKISIDLSKFNFTSVLNTLQVVMDLSVDKTQDDCIDKQYGGDSYGIQWVKLKIGGKSLYGRFIKKGIIDGRVISVSNTILDKELQLSNSTSKQTQTYIGINVPRYTNKVSLDPDISMLLEGEKDSSCTSSESKGLSVGQIVGIAVGSAMGLIFVSLITIYLIKRKYKIVLKGKEKGLIKLERTQN